MLLHQVLEGAFKVVDSTEHLSTRSVSCNSLILRLDFYFLHLDEGGKMTSNLLVCSIQPCGLSSRIFTHERVADTERPPPQLDNFMRSSMRDHSWKECQKEVIWDQSGQE